MTRFGAGRKSMRRQHGLSVLTIGLALLVLAVAAAPSEAQSKVPINIQIPINFGDAIGQVRLTSFAVDQADQLVAHGILTGVVQTATGPVSILRTIAVPVTIDEATCESLHLEVGPGSLDLLGVVQDLHKIVLHISTEAGSGDRVKLLCAIAKARDNPHSLAKLIDQLLRTLVK